MIPSTSFQSEINKKLQTLLPENKNIKLKKDFCDTKKTEIMQYQYIAEKYLNVLGNRGLLLYHQLGSGKTLSILLTAESMNRKAIIIIPAMLRYVFIAELKKHFPEKYKTNDDIKKKYSFISYNSPALMSQYEKLSAVGEELELSDLKKSDENVSSMIKNLKKNKFSNKFIAIDECHTFFQNVVSANAKQAMELFEKMMEATNAKFLFSSATPLIGNPFELVPLFNILRGEIIDENGTKFTLFPIDHEAFEDGFVDKKNGVIKNKDIFQDRITGLISHYPGMEDPNQYVIPKKLDIKIINVDMSPDQFTRYFAVRTKELDDERRSRFSTRSFEKMSYKKSGRKSKTTYKQGSRQACNFAYPSKVEKKMQKFMKDFPGLKSKDYNKEKLKIFESLVSMKELKENIGKFSGKMSEIYKLIMSSKDELIFGFSNFIPAGIRMFAKLLAANGWKDFEHTGKGGINTYAIIDGSTKDPETIINAFNDPKNIYGSEIRVLLGSIVVAAGLTFNNVRKVIIFEPQWRTATISQIIGRPIRICSHKLLPPEKRTVQPYLFVSTIPLTDKKKLIGDDGKSTDEILYEISGNIDKLNMSFIKTIEEIAIDCTMNGKSECRVCKPTNQSLFDPSLKKHMIQGSICDYEIKKELIDIIYKNIKYKIDNENIIYMFDEKEKGYREVGKKIGDKIVFF
jgi:hypothetical protein